MYRSLPAAARLHSLLIKTKELTNKIYFDVETDVDREFAAIVTAGRREALACRTSLLVSAATGQSAISTADGMGMVNK